MKKLGCFTFTWSIHNYSRGSEMNTCIESPFFAVESLGGSEWNLGLYPKGNGAPGFISCYLRGRENHSEFCAFTLSFRKSNGTFEKKYEGIYESGARTEGEEKLINHLELTEPSAYLENDTLTICCKMWKEGGDLAESEIRCCAHMKVRVSKLDYVWNLKNTVIFDTSKCKLNQSVKIPTFISGVPKVEMHVLYEGSLGEDAVHFGIKMPQQEVDIFLVMKVHILDKDGEIIHSVCAEHLFDLVDINQIWNFPIISKLILYRNNPIYMPSGELTFKCEFSFSGIPEVSSVAYGCDKQEIKCVTPHPSTDGYKLWKENMHTFFKNGKLSDVIVRTSSHEFPVHRAILCAQSEVFLAMFEKDMKENRHHRD